MCFYILHWYLSCHLRKAVLISLFLNLMMLQITLLQYFHIKTINKWMNKYKINCPTLY